MRSVLAFCGVLALAVPAWAQNVAPTQQPFAQQPPSEHVSSQHPSIWGSGGNNNDKWSTAGHDGNDNDHWGTAGHDGNDDPGKCRSGPTGYNDGVSVERNDILLLLPGRNNGGIYYRTKCAGNLLLLPNRFDAGLYDAGPDVLQPGSPRFSIWPVPSPVHATDDACLHHSVHNYANVLLHKPGILLHANDLLHDPGRHGSTELCGKREHNCHNGHGIQSHYV